MADAEDDVFDVYEFYGRRPDRSLRRTARAVLASVQVVAEAGRRELMTTAALQLLSAVAIVVQLLAGRQLLHLFIDRRDAGLGLGQIGRPIGFFVAATVVGAFVEAVQIEFGRLLGELVERHAFNRIIDVSVSVPLEAFETPAFFDHLRRAEIGGQAHIASLARGLIAIEGALLAVAGLFVGLAVLEPLLVPFALFAYVPIWLATASNGRAHHRFLAGWTASDRLRDYLRTLLLGRPESKEIRAFSLVSLLRGRYDELFDRRIHELRRLARSRIFRALAASLASAVLTVGSLGILAVLFLQHHLSVASAGAAGAAFVQLAGRLRALGSGAGAVYEASLFVVDYQSFLELEVDEDSTVLTGPVPSFSSFAVEGVSFTYSGAAAPALDDVSLHVKSGEIVALVGDNGSGKTTLAKILACLYSPSTGRVLWADTDVRSLPKETLRSGISIIFQDYVRYALTAADNISAGRASNVDDMIAIRRAAALSGADSFLRALPLGYDTILGKEFKGGVDLSLGQWQRVALARALFRDASLLILDEPTAALDPKAEHDLFSELRKRIPGRSILLISHRYSSVRHADRIYVLDHGRIAEEGTHEELLAARGRYAAMYELQAAAYLQPIGSERHRDAD